MGRTRNDCAEIKPDLHCLEVKPTAEDTRSEAAAHLRIDIPGRTGSTPLRELSPDSPSPTRSPVVKAGDAGDKRNQPFSPHTQTGEKQCTNCGETDTPQWRGTLCNACALWKRSRGTDRPLPLLFPVRKRPRSPSLDEESDDVPEVAGSAGMAGLAGSGAVGMRTKKDPVYWLGPGMTPPLATAHPGQHAVVGLEGDEVGEAVDTAQGRCMACGEAAAVSVDGWALCGRCLRNDRNVSAITSKPTPRRGTDFFAIIMTLPTGCHLTIDD